MYKSPIEITCNDYMKQYVEQVDNSVFMAIEKKFGTNIDRVELIKALNYDRGQYEKGFEDGKKAAQPTWISCAERLPDEDGKYLTYRTDEVKWGKFSSRMSCLSIEFYSVDFEGWWNDGVKLNDVTHWMPLPQPPKGDE